VSAAKFGSNQVRYLKTNVQVVGDACDLTLLKGVSDEALQGHVVQK